MEATERKRKRKKINGYIEVKWKSERWSLDFWVMLVACLAEWSLDLNAFWSRDDS